MKENSDSINKFVFNTNIICVRSEGDVNFSKEVDVLVRDKSICNAIERDFFLKGGLIDKLSFNKPHVKISNLNNKGEIAKEYDLVSQLYVFDKSRWFKLVRNNKYLSTTTQFVDGLEVYSLSLYDKYVTLLLHSIADKKSPTFKYLPALENYRKVIEIKELQATLSNYYISYNQFRKIEKSFFSKNRLVLTRRLLFISLGVKQPINLFLGFMKKIWRFSNLIKKSLFNFKVIVFMGADGSGKTTTINELIKYLGVENCYYVHLGNKSLFLPTTRFFLNRKENKRSEKSNSKKEAGGEIQRESFLQKLKILAFNLNLFCEIYTHICWIYIKNSFFQKKKYIFIDRYIYDRYQINESILKYKLFPSPDFTMLLDAELDTLLARKSEHSRSVIESFRNRYYSFLLRQDFSKTIRIDSENNLKDNIILIDKLLNNGN